MRKKGDPAENGRSKVNRQALPLLAGLALFTLLAAVSCGGTVEEQQRAKGPTEDEQASTEEPLEAGAGLGHPSLGDEDAPVVVIEYADYQ